MLFRSNHHHAADPKAIQVVKMLNKDKKRQMTKTDQNYAFDFLDAGLALDEGFDAGLADLDAVLALGFDAAVFAAA